MNLPQPLWLRLNRIRAGNSCCAYMLHKREFIESPLCECGALQTMEHISHRIKSYISEINRLSVDAMNWLEN